MFEYEIDSQGREEEKKQFDYNYKEEAFLNPIVVKGPDGTVFIGTESKDKDTKEALCWNCQSHIIYRKGTMAPQTVVCFSCGQINNMEVNNSEEKIIIKWTKTNYKRF